MTYNIGSALQADLASIQAGIRQLTDTAAALPQVSGDATTPAGGFAQSLRDAVHRVDAQDRAAGDLMADVDAGRSDDLVGAMLASQEASLSFSMLMQVRNKVMGAVEELIKLPL